MKALIVTLALVMAAGSAFASEQCSEESKNVAMASYLRAIQGKGSLAKVFKKQIAGMSVELSGENSILKAENVSAICIQQGASMHSGQVSSLETFLVVHKFSMTGGLVNEGSLLAIVGVHGESGIDENGSDSSRTSVTELRFTELK